jgi:hypothetical protein
MGKQMKYYVVQRIKDGKWVNDSMRFFLQGLTGALKCYTYLKITCPNEKYRIAKGKAELLI